MAKDISNPFLYGSLALGEAFTDREEELAELAADIRNGQDVVITAPRRYGKSSLVRRASDQVRRRGVLVAYCDLFTTPSKDRFAEKLARTIYHDIASPLERVKERALAFFRGLRVQPTVTVNPDDATLTFGFATGYRSADLDATVEELLSLPGRISKDRGRRVALVLDEFQEITAIDPQYPRLLRAVFQEQPDVAHVYLGSKRHLMEQIFSDKNEPFWRSARVMELGLIPPPLFASYIRDRFAATKRMIADAAVDRILDLTKGHPYNTQELCYFVWEEGTDGGADTTTVERALERLLDSENNHFTLLLEGASRNQRLLLEALAESAGHVFSEEYRRSRRLPAPTSVQKGLSALVRQELVVQKSDGSYRIADPFLREWLRRRHV